MKDKLNYWLALSEIGLSHGDHYQKLWEHFQSIEAIFGASPSDLAPILKPATVRAILNFENWKKVDAALSSLSKLGSKIGLITLEDSLYPSRLRNIFDPPPLLYIRGKWNDEENPLPLAVVGTRKPTPYGMLQTQSISADLSKQGFTIVSGMALGIDGEAHRTSLREGKKTIAVLGCGVNVIYPPKHKKLIQEIEEGGGILTEFPPGTPPLKPHFPKRNRIISGLSLGTFVVEAKVRSGSLITAHHALEQGRDVFALPGRVDAPESAGPNLLIQKGAKLVMQAADIIEEYEHLPGFMREANEMERTLAPAICLTPEESALVQCLNGEPTHFDAVQEKLSLSPAAISRNLSSLMLKGVIHPWGGQRYGLTPEGQAFKLRDGN